MRFTKRRSSSAAQSSGLLGEVEIEAMFELLPLVLDHLAQSPDRVFSEVKATPTMFKQLCRGLLGAAAMRGGLNDGGPAHDVLCSVDRTVWGATIVQLLEHQAPWIPIPLSAELLELDIHKVDLASPVDIESAKNTVVALLERNLKGRKMVILGHLCRLLNNTTENTVRRALSNTDGIIKLTEPLFKPVKLKKRSKSSEKIAKLVRSRLADLREIFRFIVRCHEMVFVNVPPLTKWMSQRERARSKRVRRSVAYISGSIPGVNLPTANSEDSDSDSEDENVAYNAVALRDFCSEDVKELDLHKGDKIVVTKLSPDGWWEGLNSDETTGIFPSTFVEITGRAEGKTAGLNKASSFRKRLEMQMHRSMARKKKLKSAPAISRALSGKKVSKIFKARVPRAFEHRSDILRAEIKHSENTAEAMKAEMKAMQEKMQRLQKSINEKRAVTTRVQSPIDATVPPADIHHRAKTNLSVGIDISTSFGKFLEAWDEINQPADVAPMQTSAIARTGSKLFAAGMAG